MVENKEMKVDKMKKAAVALGCTAAAGAAASMIGAVVLFKRVIPRDIESQRKEDCFVLSSGNQIAELCPLMTINCQKQIEEWNYDFHLFKNQCKPKRYAAKYDMQGELN